MDLYEVLLPYEDFGFYLVDVEKIDMLFLDLEECNAYATVNNLNGYIPKNHDEPIIWALFNDDDSLQWSVTLDNSFQLFELLQNRESEQELLNTLCAIREDNIAREDALFLDTDDIELD